MEISDKRRHQSLNIFATGKGKETMVSLEFWPRYETPVQACLDIEEAKKVAEILQTSIEAAEKRALIKDDESDE